MTHSPFPQLDLEAKAPRGIYSDLIILYPRSWLKSRNQQTSFHIILNLQGWAVPHNVEWAGNIGEDSRRSHWQTPASPGLHHRLPQQTSRGGGKEEEGEEERGEGRQDGEKWQQGGWRQKLAGLWEVSAACGFTAFIYWARWIKQRKKRGKNLALICLIYVPPSQRLKGLLDKEDQESEVIKDSPDSPEPLNKKPRLSSEEVQPLERAKGTHSCHFIKYRKRSHRHVSIKVTFYHFLLVHGRCFQQ